MDVTVQLPTDATERRRMQNRIAQRKFRHKRLQSQAASSAASSAASTCPPAVVMPSQLSRSSRGSVNGMAPATSAAPVSGSSPGVFHVMDIGVGPDVSPIADDAGPMDDLGLGMYLDGGLDFCFDLGTPPMQSPMRTMPPGLQPSATARPSHSGLPTPQTTTPPSVSSASPARSVSCYAAASAGDSRLTPPARSVAPTPQRDAVQGIPAFLENENHTNGRDSEQAGKSGEDGRETESEKGWLGTLHIAVQSGNERILDMLLQQDKEGINSLDSNGRTPLFHGAIQDNAPIVQLLLAHGARVGLLDNEGRSPLHWAVLYRRLEVLRTLLEHWKRHERDCFDIDARDNVGWTPLHLAVERRFEAGVRLLMQSGANIKARANMCSHTSKPIPFNVEPLGS